MRTGTKMLMLTKGNETRSGGMDMQQGRSDMRMGYGGMENTYGANMTYGGAQSNYGRSGLYPRREYDHGMEDSMEPESRRRYSRHRDGTFAPRSDMRDEGGEMYSPMSGYDEPGVPRMGKIGFEAGQTGHNHRGNVVPLHGGEKKLTRDMAEEWMENLQNEDGSKGPHWTMDQTKQVMAQRGIKGEPLEFYVILNALYSDYCKVFQKHNINKIDLYADLASAWINDKDAMDGKAALYYECIVQK